MEQVIYPSLTTSEIDITHKEINQLNHFTRWGYLISISGFIVVGFFFLVAFTANSWADSLSYYNHTGSVYQSNSPTDFSLFISLSYILMAVIYFFPAFSLFRFTRKTRRALRRSDEVFLEDAQGALKTYFIFIGILLFIALALFLGGIGMLNGY